MSFSFSSILFLYSSPHQLSTPHLFGETLEFRQFFTAPLLNTPASSSPCGDDTTKSCIFRDFLIRNASTLDDLRAKRVYLRCPRTRSFLGLGYADRGPQVWTSCLHPRTISKPFLGRQAWLTTRRIPFSCSSGPPSLAISKMMLVFIDRLSELGAFKTHKWCATSSHERVKLHSSKFEGLSQNFIFHKRT